MDIMQFINENSLIIIPALYILGLFFKVSAIKDNLIPTILLVVSVVFSVCSMGFGIDAVIQGILTAGAAVFADQLVKQARK